MATSLSLRIIDLIKQIPPGKVTTYGRIAAMAGSPGGARQVVRILHACSEKEALPWFRVINAQGKISLRPGQGFELQKTLLEKEGIVFENNSKINFEKYLWLDQ